MQGSDAETRPTIDFDHHSTEYARNHAQVYADLFAGKCPVAFSPRHGGFWLVSGYDEVAVASKDDATFSSKFDASQPDVPSGVSIPSVKPMRATPLEMDPPEYYPYRKLLNSWFSPNAAKRMEPSIRDYARGLIDAVIEKGTFDVVLDYANAVPALMTMELLGLPLDRWEEWSEPFHSAVYSVPGTAEFDQAQLAFGAVLGEIMSVVVPAKRENPGQDFLSFIATCDKDGVDLSDQTIVEMVVLIIFGGVATTTALTAQALIWLSNHPEERLRLIEHPELRPRACEEFLRHVSPVQLLARTVTADTVLGDQELRAGDRLMLSWAGANRDPAHFDDPDAVIIDREPNRHTAFGLGIHRCLGSNFARTGFLVMLDEVLERMPDYTIDVDAVVPYHTIGIDNGIISAPARFTPGPKLGSHFQR